MTLAALIQKGGLAKVATATPATLATQKTEIGRPVAAVATVAVASPPELLTATPTRVPVSPMTEIEETAIRAWLAYIQETDQDTLGEVLNECRTDAGAREYFIGRAGEVPRPTDQGVNASSLSTQKTVEYQPPFIDPSAVEGKS